MKTIGLLGGTSWPSTPLYYEYLNQRIADALGEHHSAKIMLYSIDYHQIKSRYNAPDGWDDIPALLKAELVRLDETDPDCILICNNTLHKAYDILVEQQDIALSAQLIHGVVATAQHAQSIDAKRVLLLGTKFTMEDGFFADRLRFFGLEVEVPNADDRNTIQDIQTRIASGQIDLSFEVQFRDMLKAYTGFDAVILGCTELPMVITDKITNIPLINPIHVQCDEAIKLVLSSFASE